MKKIKSALISVFYKDGLDDIVKKLDQLGVTIYSTGGTFNFIESLGVKPQTDIYRNCDFIACFHCRNDETGNHRERNDVDRRPGEIPLKS